MVLDHLSDMASVGSGSYEYLLTIKTMIEENVDPRQRNDGTRWRVEAALAELYAAVCQCVAVANHEAAARKHAVEILDEISQSLDILHGQVRKATTKAAVVRAVDDFATSDLWNDARQLRNTLAK